MPIDPIVVLLRWLQFAAAVAALGAPLFQLYAFPRTPLTSVRVASLLAGLVLAIAAGAGLVAQTVMMAGSWAAGMDGAALAYVIQSTGLGAAHVVRLGLSLLGVTLLLIWPRGKVAMILAVAAFAGATASFAWSGHGASGEGLTRSVHLVADVVHALAAALWLGALVGFSLMLARPGRVQGEALARSLAAFASIGTGAVATLVVTGLVNSVFLVGAEGAPRLAASAWGLLLLGKLALFVVMMGLAAHNRFTLTPALAKANEDGGRVAALRRLRLSIGVELAAGVALLGLVAAMGVQMPPASM